MIFWYYICRGPHVVWKTYVIWLYDIMTLLMWLSNRLLRVRGRSLWVPVAIQVKLVHCSVFSHSTTCPSHNFNANVYCGSHRTLFLYEEHSFVRIFLWLPTVHLGSVRKSILPSFRKPCQCYCDCGTREKGEGQKVMSYFPSYSQWLAERANSLEGLKRWMHEMAGGGEKR
jgi:hypothetical protein